MEICQFVPKYLDILGFLLFFFRFRLYKISNLNFVTKGLLFGKKYIFYEYFKESIPCYLEKDNRGLI